MNAIRRLYEEWEVLQMIGRIVDYLDGKKQMIASLGAALVATGTILATYSQTGNSYLLHVAQTPEFAAASIGWVGFFNALHGQKVRAEIAQVNQQKGDTK